MFLFQLYDCSFHLLEYPKCSDTVSRRKVEVSGILIRMFSFDGCILDDHMVLNSELLYKSWPDLEKKERTFFLLS